MLFRKKEITKGKFLQLRVTDEEKVQLKKKADAHNMTLSQYLLRAGLGRPIATSNTNELVLELINLGRIQKELYLGDGRNKQQYLDILIVIVAAIKSIPHRITKTK